MLSEWELWTCAHRFILEQGDDAAVIAAIRCDELSDAKDFEGVKNSQAIIDRINRLLEKP